MKLNSADFQRGGFDADDAGQVIAMLEPLGVDLVELSGAATREAAHLVAYEGHARGRSEGLVGPGHGPPLPLGVDEVLGEVEELMPP